ncbi:MAG: Mrp/NBP35 family ATP-binding protein [Ignavibacteria bacterium]|nr:Mrp/NBP35 family ATP-binding protein [Ignavibacteria bacterium]
MNKEKIIAVLSKTDDPVLNTDFVTLDFVRNISLNGNNLSLKLGVSDNADESVSKISDKLKSELKKSIPEIESVNIDFVTGFTSHKDPKKMSIMPGIKNTIAVASGKGGVGKSTIAVNLAVALSKLGAKVGLIDADIYGPSIPLMFGINKKPGVMKIGEKNMLVPLEKFGVKIMSIGFLIENDSAVVWRGPMASSALKQFIGDVVWDELDFLLFDMPPGTGDIQLTLSQTIPLTGAIIVTTPQEISLSDAKKGYIMFERVNVPTIGIIENMSYFNNPDGSREYIFGKEGGKKMSEEYNVKLLGEIPINTKIRIGGDKGIPVAAEDEKSETAGIFYSIAAETVKEINKMNIASSKKQNLEIEI